MAQVTVGRPKIALVTGANKGIGKAIVKGLAGAGLTVYLGARDELRGKAAVADLAEEGEVRFIRIDVTDELSVRAAAERIEADFGLRGSVVRSIGFLVAVGSFGPSE